MREIVIILLSYYQVNALCLVEDHVLTTVLLQEFPTIYMVRTAWKIPHPKNEIRPSKIFTPLPGKVLKFKNFPTQP